MSWKKYKFRDFLTRSKIPIQIEDKEFYKRVTIRTKHQGVSVRDSAAGIKIGTKKQFILKSGQFVLSKIDARYGAFGIADEDVDGAIITGNFWAYDVDFSIINIEWFNQFTNSKKFYEVCERASSGITHRKYLNENFFLNYEINLPSIDEQLSIIEEFKKNKISNDNLSSELTYQLYLVKQLRQAFLREAMQGKLTSKWRKQHPELIEGANSATELLKKITAEKEELIKQKKIKRPKPIPSILEFEIPFEVPENWVWCRLGEFSYITSGSTPQSSAFIQEGIPFLKMYNLRNQKIDFYYKPQFIKKEIHNGPLARCRAYPGDLIMNIVGPPLGKLAIIPDDLAECSFNQAAVLIRPTLLKINKYLFWYLSEMSEINEVETKGVAGQNNISVTQAHSMKVPLPPLSEQQQIVTKLDQLMHYCDQLEESIKVSQQQNELLLQQVLREALEPKTEIGKVALPNPSTKKPLGKIIQFKTRKCDPAERAILAGHIINQTNSENFGRVKFQKLLYLVEHHCHFDFDSNYKRKVAGPHASELIKEVESTLQRFRFYEIKQSQARNHKVNYTPLNAAPELDSIFLENFANEALVVDEFLSKFKNKDMEQCEIVATLYAVWNNRILQDQPISDELLKEDFLNWDKQKIKYKDRLDSALEWMRKKDIIPTGWGKEIE